jgi:hypothetical protein
MLSEAEIFDRYCVVGTLRGCEIYLKIPEALNFINLASVLREEWA